MFANSSIEPGTVFSFLFLFTIWLFTNPRAIGDARDLHKFPDFYNATAGGIVNDGFYFPQGLWCTTSPSCDLCTDCSICPVCFQCIITRSSKSRLREPQCSMQCEYGMVPKKTPGIYAIIVAISTAYLIVQLKQLLLLWLPRLRDRISKIKLAYHHDLQIVADGHKTSYQMKAQCLFEKNCDRWTQCCYNGHGGTSILSGVHGLPMCMTRNILEYMVPKDYLKCELVCKEWYNAITNCSYIWMDAYQRHFYSNKKWCDQNRYLSKKYDVEKKRINADIDNREGVQSSNWHLLLPAQSSTIQEELQLRHPAVASLQPPFQTWERHAAAVSSKTIFKNMYIFDQAQRHVESYETLCNYRDEEQAEQFTQWKALENLRDFASIASILAVLWQYLDVVIELLQWITALACIVVVVYLASIPLSQFNGSRQLLYLTMGVVVCVILPTVVSLFLKSQQSFNFTMEHVSIKASRKFMQGSQEGENIGILNLQLATARFFPWCLLILRVVMFLVLSGDYDIQSFSKQVSLIGAIGLLGECVHGYYGAQASTDLVVKTFMVEVLYPLSIFTIRLVEWVYFVGSVVITLLDDPNINASSSGHYDKHFLGRRTLQYLYILVKPSMLLAVTEAIFYCLGKKNYVLDLLTLLGKKYAFDLIRGYTWWRCFEASFQLLWWPFLSLRRHRKKLFLAEYEEWKNVVVSLVLLEALSHTCGVSLQFLHHLPTFLLSLFHYLHWSRSITTLMCIFVFCANKLPCHRPTGSRGVVFALIVESTACTFLLLDSAHDVYDKPIPYQPYISMLWVGLWLFY